VPGELHLNRIPIHSNVTRFGVFLQTARREAQEKRGKVVVSDYVLLKERASSSAETREYD
jgi:hypothetical protein